MYEDKRQQLEALEQVFSERLAAVTHDLSAKHSADFAEQVTEREDEDVLRNLQDETRTELQHVRTALKRIASGEYGACSSCGADISPARLEALPYATLCIHCAD